MDADDYKQCLAPTHIFAMEGEGRITVRILVRVRVRVHCLSYDITSDDVTQGRGTGEGLEPRPPKITYDGIHWGGAGRGSDDVIENFKIVRLS